MNQPDPNQICFVSDLHGSEDRYKKLFAFLREQTPKALFIGGDILPPLTGFHGSGDFLEDYLLPEFRKLKQELGSAYPPVFIILGNDDPRAYEQEMEAADAEGLWHYMHQRKGRIENHPVFGYAHIPPTPFRLKDWERYDVSRYVDPGCTHPTEGTHTVEPGVDLEYTTIAGELEELLGEQDLTDAIVLFHSPPYKSNLDRAALDGMMVDHVPLDPHVGSIAIQRMIEKRQPAVTLHGHIHESSRLTGSWKQQFGHTWSFNAAIEKRNQLAVICFDPRHPAKAERKIL